MQTTSPTKEKGGATSEGFSAILLIGGLLAVIVAAYRNDSNLKGTITALSNGLQDGTIVLNISGEKIDTKTPDVLDRLAVSLLKKGSDSVVIELKQANGNAVIHCVTTGKAAATMLEGYTPNANQVKELKIDTKTLAQLCSLREDQILPLGTSTKPQASANGPYSVKTDGAVAMGTLKGDIGQVAYKS